VADVAGVAADQIARELVHEGGDRVIAVGLGVALTPAVQAVGGLDLHEEPVLAVAGVDDERGDGGDLHARISSRGNVSAARRARPAGTAAPGRPRSADRPT